MKLRTCATLATLISVNLVSHAGSVLQTSDARFVRDMAIANMAEIQLGRLASERGTSSFVRDFGTMMVKDHQFALNELDVLAQKKGMTLPKDVDSKHQALYSRLDRLNLTAFDNAYQNAMIEGHKAVLSMLRNESKWGESETFRNYAMMYAPIVERHLMMAADGSIGLVKIGR